MFHTHNKWEDVVTTSNPPIQPTISQTLSYSTFMGVQQIPPNQQILHLQQQDLTITPPNGIVPTGYTWSVVTGVNYFTLRVYSGETTNTPIFATSFPLGLQRPKECIIQCILTYSGGTYTIPYVLRWQRQQPEDVIATITNGSNSYVVNGNNSVLTQQPTIQIVGSTITSWTWSVVSASWPSYTASSITITNGNTATPTFISTIPTNELPGYYVISCNIAYLSPTNYAVTNLVYSIVQVY